VLADTDQDARLAVLDSQIDFGSQSYLAAPWETLLPIGRCVPIFWSRTLHGWVVTRHADVKAGYADPRLSAQRMDLYRRVIQGDADRLYPLFFKYQGQVVNMMDRPALIRVRALMLKAFGRQQVEQIAPALRQAVGELLDEAESAGTLDFVDMVASRLPMRVLQIMLGVSEKYNREFFTLASAVVRASGAAAPTPEQLAIAEESIARLNAIFIELIEQRRAAPADDLLSALVSARDNADKLSEDELLAACLIIIEAGAETTVHMLGVAVREIALRPELQARVRQSIEDADKVAVELLRYPGLVMCMTRIAAEDFDWHDAKVKAGDLVFLMNNTANMDTAVFPDPEHIDPDRNNQASMAFGPGLHHCLGHLLARKELSEFLYATFERFDVEVLEQEVKYISSLIFRGLERLQVRVTARG
jgi:cytochrome P450